MGTELKIEGEDGFFLEEDVIQITGRDYDDNGCDIQVLQDKVKKLETEITTLRGELRLFRRKFQSFDSFRHEEIVEKIVFRVLDNQNWKMVRENLLLGNNENESNRANRISKKIGLIKRKEVSTVGVQNEDMNSTDYNLSSTFEPDPLLNYIEISDNETNEIETENTSTPYYSKKVQHGAHAEANLQEPNNIIIEIHNKSYSKPASKQKPPPRLVLKNGTYKYGQTYQGTTEFKEMAVKRAEIIGFGAAGRELNVPESSIRTWKRMKLKYGEVPMRHGSTNATGNFPTIRRKYKQGYNATPQFKLKVCERCKEVGSRKAGNEYNVPEGSIRTWMKNIPKILSAAKMDTNGVGKRKQNSKRVSVDTEAIFGSTVPSPYFDAEYRLE